MLGHCSEDELYKRSVQVGPASYWNAAVALFGAGFNSIAVLRGFRLADAEDMGTKASATVLLHKVFDHVKKDADDDQHNFFEATREARKRQTKENPRKTHCNAEEVASTLTLEPFKQGWQAMDVEVNNLNINDVSTGKTKPKTLFAQWCDGN